MHREKGILEVRRRTAQQSVSISKIKAKSRTQAEFASWTSGFLLIVKREHPSTIKAKRAKSTEKTRGDSKSYRGTKSSRKPAAVENICAANDVIASEDDSYIATRWERSRNENSWKLVLNSEGTNGPVDQRDDYKEAKKTCDKLNREYAATAGYVNTRIHHQDHVRQRPEQFEGHEDDFLSC